MEKVFYTNNKKDNKKFLNAIRNINAIYNANVEKIYDENEDEEFIKELLKINAAKHKNEINEYCAQNLKTTCENIIKSGVVKKQNKFKKLEYSFYYYSCLPEKADIIIFDGSGISFYKKSVSKFTVSYLTKPIKIYNHAVEKITDSFEKKVFEYIENAYKFYLQTYTTQHVVLKYDIDKKITDARHALTNDDLTEEYYVANKLIA